SMYLNGNVITQILYKDGNLIDANDINVKCEVFPVNNNEFSYEGYDVMKVYLKQDDYLNSPSIYLKNIDRVYLDIYLPLSTTPNRFTFTITPELRKYLAYNDAYIDLIGDKDTIEKLTCDIGDSYKIEGKDIELYLRKSMTDPIEEVNWDGKTNAFEYIIKQQFYEITPNPNAATTLYTDYNITSSKIITADNITTMRTDVNVLTNNFDVMLYDVKKLRVDVNKLQIEMLAQQYITSVMRRELDAIHFQNKVKLIFGLAGLIVGLGGIVVDNMEGISFGTRAIYNNEDISSANADEIHLNINDPEVSSNISIEDGGTVQRLIGSGEAERLTGFWHRYTELVMRLDMHEGNTPEDIQACDLILNEIGELTQIIEDEYPGAEMPDWVSVLIRAPWISNSSAIHTASNKNILDILMEWCDKKYKRLDDPTKFKNNWINPEKAVFTVSAAIDVCNRMRDSMKLPIKILAHELREIQQKVGNG
ncbi:hypothetical protein, partial [Helicobacter typhlonius]|uniref:hypothetical protein n=1 Tax=Helicobacter typhlonius TaxID=76936 RepID=UPI0032207762